MTNDELNRKVAKLRGWKLDAFDHWVDVNNDSYDDEGTVPDYCDNALMWGGLFVELAEEGRTVKLLHTTSHTHQTNHYHAEVMPLPFPNRGFYSIGRDPSPGRAICLAYVASCEVQ